MPATPDTASGTETARLIHERDEALSRVSRLRASIVEGMPVLASAMMLSMNSVEDRGRLRIHVRFDGKLLTLFSHSGGGAESWRAQSDIAAIEGVLDVWYEEVEGAGIEDWLPMLKPCAFPDAEFDHWFGDEPGWGSFFRVRSAIADLARECAGKNNVSVLHMDGMACSIDAYFDRLLSREIPPTQTSAALEHDRLVRVLDSIPEETALFSIPEAPGLPVWIETTSRWRAALPQIDVQNLRSKGRTK